MLGDLNSADSISALFSSSALVLSILSLWFTYKRDRSDYSLKLAEKQTEAYRECIETLRLLSPTLTLLAEQSDRKALSDALEAERRSKELLDDIRNATALVDIERLRAAAITYRVAVLMLTSRAKMISDPALSS